MILEEVIKWIVPLVLTSMVAYISNETKRNKQRNTVINNAIISLLRSQIVGLAEQYIKFGYLPDYARFTLNDLYLNYHTLGANHGIELLVEQCNELPPCLKPPCEKEKI